MDLLANLFNILWEVVKGYFTHGLLFFLAHLIVAWFLYQSWRNVRKATTDLKNWRPQATPLISEAVSPGCEYLKTVPHGMELVGILDLYVAESEKMGKQGAFVPMTDYSDRLDSIIDGLISELQDRTNLFLIVGIAGTLFGLFEFAFNSYAELQNSSTQTGSQLLSLGKFLSQSMSKAFPVGFVGLFLTFVAQLGATRPEGRLREALAGAARLALERRKEAGISQVENLHHAVAAMQKAMQPLENLSATLSEGLKPVADALGERVDKLMAMTETQFSQMQRATQELQETVGGLKESVNSINLVTTRVEDLFRQLPILLNSFATLLDRQRDSIETFDRQGAERLQDAQKMEAAIQESIENFGKMPRQLAGDFKDVFTGLGGAALKTWDNYSSEYTRSLQSAYQNFLLTIETGAGKVENGLIGASDEFHRVAQNFDHLVRTPMRDLFEELRKDLSSDLEKLNNVVAQRYPKAAEDIMVFSARLDTLLAQSNELQGALIDWLTGVRDAGVQMEELNRAVTDVAGRLSSVQQPVADPKTLQLLQGIGLLLREMQTQMADLKGISAEVRDATVRLAEPRRKTKGGPAEKNTPGRGGWFSRLFNKRRDDAGVN
jgi:methyl-accepting chemotaxis protein